MLSVIPGSPGALPDAIWIDLLNPTDDERRQVEQATKLRLPTREEIEEIESSSRVFREGAASYLSTPVPESVDADKADQGRIDAIRGDIASLNDYQANLSGKVQFLLDATLGFISIEQNEIFKALTVASVVGVPPVLIAGIYGMNFRNMPELQWSL